MAVINLTAGADEFPNARFPALTPEADTVNGLAGEDIIEVGANDEAFGNEDNDTLTATGNATLYGGLADDTLTGLRQKLSPNVTQTGFIGSKQVTI